MKGIKALVEKAFHAKQKDVLGDNFSPMPFVWAMPHQTEKLLLTFADGASVFIPECQEGYFVAVLKKPYTRVEHVKFFPISDLFVINALPSAVGTDEIGIALVDIPKDGGEVVFHSYLHGSTTIPFDFVIGREV